MSVTIRLARIGKRNAPAYKIVVANTRDKRNGRFLDILGHYNPANNPVLLDIDKKKVKEWQVKGALTSDAVAKLIDGTYEYEPYTRQNEKSSEKESSEEGVVEEAAPAEEVSADESSEVEDKKETESTEAPEGEAAESPEDPTK